VRRSRPLASIPRTRVDPAHSHRSRAHASIPCTRIDPVRLHRSCALASIPHTHIDPVCSPPFNQADPASSDYTGSSIGASAETDASSSCAPVPATLANGDGVDAKLAAFLSCHTRLQPRTQEIMLKALNDGYALVDFEAEAADRTVDQLLLWLTDTVGFKRATADALAKALQASPSAPAPSKAQPASEEHPVPEAESTKVPSAKRQRNPAPASASARADPAPKPVKDAAPTRGSKRAKSAGNPQVRSHRSRTFASIPHNYTDPAHSHRSRALA